MPHLLKPLAPMKRIYISGPMTGLPEFNAPAFHAEAKRLRALGYDVVNPAEINDNPVATWNDCMRRDIAVLVTCDAIALMDGWMTSSGVHLEMHIAHRLGMHVVMASWLVDEINYGGDYE